MKIYFEKLANFVRKDEYAKVSIPFEKGKFTDESMLSILDNDGNKLKTQTEVLSRWDDNSIKWLLVHFFATLPANDKIDFNIDITKKNEVLEKMNLDECLKNCIDLSFSINVNGKDYNKDFVFSDLKDYKVLTNGNVVSQIQLEDNFEIEDNKNLTLITNVELYNGKTYAKIDFKLINKSSSDLKLSDAYVVYKSDTKFDDGFIAHSNYRTKYKGFDGNSFIYDEIDDKRIMLTQNEHYPEVFFGAYYGVAYIKDTTIAITIKEAFQNYPKALSIEKNWFSAYLIPEEHVINFGGGMAKTHTIYVHKANCLSKEEINQRHHQFQMCDLPILDKEVYEKANICENLFTENKDELIEEFVVNLADSKGFTYGFLNYGDVFDKGYTGQGRGQSHLVFSNNEYDYPYYAYLLFARNGVRRFFDYFRVSAQHMMDIDICHYSEDKFRENGLIEHSRLHNTGNVTLSHEWLTGLIAYYHATGDLYAKKCFMDMGENILLNLERPVYNEGFEINARETGWALKALVSLYQETYDKKYLDACEKIVVHFVKWKEKYGAFLAPYTDHTTIRVPFMISVACNSLYEYYKITKNDEIKDLIISAVDDLIENAMLDNGLFYYKELPSLQRNGNNALILETLATCYTLTGDKKYLYSGVKTFELLTSQKFSFGAKVQKDGFIIVEGSGTKLFAQSVYPLLKFYSLCSESGVTWNKL